MLFVFQELALNVLFYQPSLKIITWSHSLLCQINKRWFVKISSNWILLVAIIKSSLRVWVGFFSPATSAQKSLFILTPKWQDILHWINAHFFSPWILRVYFSRHNKNEESKWYVPNRPQLFVESKREMWTFDFLMVF